jgi:hypothetical protein
MSHARDQVHEHAHGHFHGHPHDHKSPQFDEMWREFPIEGQRDLFRSLGGRIPEEANDSALRLSVCLARTGERSAALATPRHPWPG